MTPGVDRGSELVARIFDEPGLAVNKLVASVIKTARACGAKIGNYGQVPSNFPEFALFLVEDGINSISLNRDAVMKMTAKAIEIEQQTRQKHVAQKQKPQGIRDLHHLRANCARRLVAFVREPLRHGPGSQVNA